MEDLASPPTDIDPYQILEIKASATANGVKKAYRRLALRHHPGTSDTRK